MSRVLIVEDVAAMRDQYAYDLRRLGKHEVLTADGVAAALETLHSDAVDCVILDLEMPGADGFELLQTLRDHEDTTPVIVYTGTGNYERCVRAVKLGAYGFLDKSEPMERVLLEIDNAIEQTRLRGEVRQLRAHLEEDSSLVGASDPMTELRSAIAKLALIPSPVLIVGESGTGKELVARDLHRLGPRASGPFLAVNSAALPENLVESELFGHERGAFTGADRVHPGAFERAHAGTLFLDEIGELAPTMQAKLLRILEEGTVHRIGGRRAIPTDARVVAATNRNLEEEVERGRFREDLLYRVNVHTIRVPPLRERLSDVPLLAEHFVKLISKRFGRRPPTLSPEVLTALQSYDWARNNVREMRNVVERMLIANTSAEVGPEALPLGFGKSSTYEEPPSGTLKERKTQAERRIVLEALERNGWHLTNTAAELGLADHASLSKVMQRLRIQKG